MLCHNQTEEMLAGVIVLKDGSEKRFYWRAPLSFRNDVEAREEAFRLVLKALNVSAEQLEDCLLTPVPLELPNSPIELGKYN